MNLTYNSNDIYNKLIKESYKIFSKWKDSDFYSNKANHIYFYSVINDMSVSNLQQQLLKLSKTNTNINNIITTPKPIVIHLNSPGGSVLSENLINVIMTTQRVPLCVIVETLCASAATTLQLLAPYRVMIDFSSYLIHDSFGFTVGKEHEKISSEFTFVYQNLSNYLSLLRDRTELTNNEIKKFISRDILVNSSYCLKKKIVDRVLKFPKIKNSESYNKTQFTNLSLNLEKFLKKTNLNHLYIDSGSIYDGNIVMDINSSLPLSQSNTLPDICAGLDKFMLNNMTNKKPLLIHFKPSISNYMNTNCDPLELVSLQYRIALIQTKMPVFALIEGPQSLDNLASILQCPIRIMMTPSIISSYFSSMSSGSLGWGSKTIDILHNTKYIITEVIKFFKKCSKLPDKFYNDLQNKIINLKPNDAIKYELIHQIVNYKKIKPISFKNIQNYYNINDLINNYEKKNRPK